MAGSVNKVILVGNLGRDPETRDMTSGGKVTSFSIATSETWNDKASGDRREKTQWHRIAIFNERLGDIAQRFLRKGSKVYIEGQLESREYTDKDGNKREAFEVVIGRFRGELTLLDGRGGGGGETGEPAETGGGYGGGRSSAPSERSGGGGGWDRGGSGAGRPSGGARAPAKSDLDDDIPF